ncbi:hypothetical protein GH714_043595 [Hevea brasiliensis]|uniref:RING-type E3 ubiquitin transferase n=1 Tax=Hevea brasiliensis TaxID=3981 RepID=A0A6A6K4N9_HEVBR|nr:hypothetical protein GH714_043595 [Hevea brasiliensis]
MIRRKSSLFLKECYGTETRVVLILLSFSLIYLSYLDFGKPPIEIVWWLFIRKDENDLGPFSVWNITGTYRGTWKSLDSTNGSSRFPDFRKSTGESVIELVSTPTKITGVHYVQGGRCLYWPFRQLRMVANSGKEGELSQDEDYILSNPYHLLGVFSSQVFQESTRDKIWRRKNCNFLRDRYHMEGLMESPAVDDDGDCFSPLLLNATSVNIEVYYNKAVNYTLMVTFVSFLQVLLLIRQMEHSNTQSGAAKVSILMIGQQAIMDAYLCLLHLTAGILVESLFNAFATAAFFKFVVFSIFEMRYLLAIWKASRPMNSGEGWETMRRELSVLYSRFCSPIVIAFRLWDPFGRHSGHILPEKYSYYRRFDQDTNQATDCVICMTAIDLTQRSNDCMVTPCDHFFHSGCLQRWMDIKMECPTCRRPLPPA